MRVAKYGNKASISSYANSGGSYANNGNCANILIRVAMLITTRFFFANNSDCN